jgi:hypothetical protein
MTHVFRLLPVVLALGLATGCTDKNDEDTGDEDVGGGGAGGDDGSGGSGDGSGGGSGDGSGDGSEGLTPAQQFLHDYGMRGCDLYLECSPPEVLEYYPYESCVQSIETAVSNYIDGVCTFNQAAADECLAWINAVDCDGYSDDAPEACNTAYACPE